MTPGTEFDEVGRIEAKVAYGSCWQLEEWIYQMFCRVRCLLGSVSAAVVPP
jgi:hypothetical protein